MTFIYPQALPPGQFMPFMTLPPPMHPFQLQMAALQYNATLTQPGNGTFTPHVPPLIPQYHELGDSRHQDQAERGRRKTAASKRNRNLHASFGTITNDHYTISHHRWVGDDNNARSGSARRPPSLGMSAMPNQRPRSRAALQNRSKRASAIRSRRKCDELAQYVVAIDGAECM